MSVTPSPIVSFQGGVFSNFYLTPGLLLGGKPVKTLEHAYQASKATKDSDTLFVLMAPTAASAKKRGRNILIRPDWESIKLSVMKDLLRQKFSLPGFHEALLETGSRQLIEGNWWGDTFWGVCNGVGENWLGKLLMEVRQEIQEIEQ